MLSATAALGGLLVATYVRPAGATPVPGAPTDLDRPARAGGVGGLLSYFAVGCPVCNKLVVVALGTVGAREWFEPVQSLLAVASLVVLALALRARVRNEAACPVPVAR